MKAVLTFLKKKPIITMIIAFITGVAGIMLLDSDDIFAAGVLRYILALAMCVFLYLISGEKTFEKSEETTGYVIKHLMGIIIFAAVMLGLSIFGVVYSHNPLADRWFIEVLKVVFLCLGVGLFEELVFRAIMFDGFMYAFRDKKWVFAVSAVLGSLIFGYVHVMNEEMSSAVAIAQIGLKTLSTGIWGLCLLILYWKTRNIWGCAIVHAIYDILPQLCNAMFVTAEGVGESGYVNTGVLGGAAVGLYIIQIIVMVIILLVLWKKVVKTIDFEEIRRDW